MKPERQTRQEKIDLQLGRAGWALGSRRLIEEFLVEATSVRHDTSRALDPHLHSHCILFNATKDSVENCWKALETYEMHVAKKFVENVYYHELVKALNGFGYRVQNKSRGTSRLRAPPRN